MRQSLGMLAVAGSVFVAVTPFAGMAGEGLPYEGAIILAQVPPVPGATHPGYPGITPGPGYRPPGATQPDTGVITPGPGYRPPGATVPVSPSMAPRVSPGYPTYEMPRIIRSPTKKKRKGAAWWRNPSARR